MGDRFHVADLGRDSAHVPVVPSVGEPLLNGLQMLQLLCLLEQRGESFQLLYPSYIYMYTTVETR